ncbi:60s acidic ribosomal protein-domain-containing protein [Baffinella frigidus]|nr:60s acidic ribosomal protein-domain-containing protein [Cryptophyta sp. CCMP2293]|mmetsp:Transcript_15034/g.34978  ORF Transcript_15034/g.34978 Transcript_15034/m.34978 type:complete len:113 (-) Transcript_15034:39-377(-)
MAVVDTSTLACTYAALICYDDGLPVSAENIAALIKASECEVSSFWPKLFVGAMAGQDIGALCTKIGGSGGGGGGDAAPAAAAAAAPAAAAGKGKAKKEAPEEEEDMGFSLFD